MRRTTDCDNCFRAAWPILSRSALVLRGDMARASSAANVSSPFWISTRGSSRGIMFVPLDLRLLSFGLERRSGGFEALCSESMEDMELELLADKGEASRFDAGTLERGTPSDVDMATICCLVAMKTIEISHTGVVHIGPVVLKRIHKQRPG
jgi:hypothetical protein